MDTTPLRTALASIGLADLLDGYVSRARVGVRYLEIERTAARFGLRFDHEGGNIYGRLMLVEAVAAPVPRMRVVTRSDVAAVHGSGRRVA